MHENSHHNFEKTVRMRLVEISTSVIGMNDILIYVDFFKCKNRIVDQYVDESTLISHLTANYNCCASFRV